MAYRLEKPRKDQYTFYIAARDTSGNYSEVNEVTVQHPGIAQLEQPEVDRYFEAFVIEMPTIYTKISGNEVYPENTDTDERDILGYVVRLDRIDEAEEDEKDFIEKKVPFSKSSEMIEVPAKSEWEITVGVYDSVYHPDHNSDLFESTFSEPLAISARQIDDIVDFVDELRPVEIVEELPSLPDDSHPEGSIVFLWEDRQLYKQDDGSWVKVVNADDLEGEIVETQIADDSISTPKLQAEAVTANEILAGTITANEIASNTITAGQIEAGAISADEIASDAITADKISSNEIKAYHIQVDDLSAINAEFSGTLTGADGLFTGEVEIQDYSSEISGNYTTYLDGNGLEVHWEGDKVFSINSMPEVSIGELAPSLSIYVPGEDNPGVYLHPGKSPQDYSHIPTLNVDELNIQSGSVYPHSYESGTESVSGTSNGSITISFNEEYHDAIANVSIQVNYDISSSRNSAVWWTSWEENDFGRITGMNLSYINEFEDSRTIYWHIFGAKS